MHLIHTCVGAGLIFAGRAKAMCIIVLLRAVCEKNMILLKVLHPRAPVLFNILHFTFAPEPAAHPFKIMLLPL